MTEIAEAYEKRLYLRATTWMAHVCPMFNPEICYKVEHCGDLEECELYGGDEE